MKKYNIFLLLIGFALADINVMNDTLWKDGFQNISGNINIANAVLFSLQNYTLIVDNISSYGILYINNSNISYDNIIENFIATNISTNPQIKISNTFFYDGNSIYIRSCGKNSYFKNNKIIDSYEGLRIQTGSGNSIYCRLNVTDNQFLGIYHTSINIEGANVSISIERNIINSSKPMSYGIYTSNTQKITIKGNRLHNLKYYGIDIIQSDRYGEIVDNMIIGAKNPLILNTNVDDFSIVNNTIMNGYNNSNCIGLQEGSDRTHIYGNILSNCSVGIWLSDVLGQKPDNVDILANYIGNMRSHGINIQGADNSHIIENYIYNIHQNGIYMYFDASGYIIANNTFVNITGLPIRDVGSGIIYGNLVYNSTPVIYGIPKFSGPVFKSGSSNSTYVTSTEGERDGILYILIAYSVFMVIMCSVLLLYLLFEGAVEISSVIMTVGAIGVGAAIMIALAVVLSSL